MVWAGGQPEEGYWGEPERAPHKREVRAVGLSVCLSICLSFCLSVRS